MRPGEEAPGPAPTSTPHLRGALTVCALVPGVQEKLGVMNKGVVYALWGYEAQSSDELTFHEGDAITILRRKDESETEWWWARLGDREGYVPKNLLGVSPLSAPREPLICVSFAPEVRYQPAVREHWASCEDKPCWGPQKEPAFVHAPASPVNGHVCRAQASHVSSRAFVCSVFSSRRTSASSRSHLEQTTAA